MTNKTGQSTTVNPQIQGLDFFKLKVKSLKWLVLKEEEAHELPYKHGCFFNEQSKQLSFRFECRDLYKFLILIL